MPSPSRSARITSVLLLAGCAARHAPEPVAPAVPPAPHLPAPVGELYVHHVGRPIDPLVAQVLAGRPWEEVLSGAATGLALSEASRGGVDLSAARWAAVRAGYPFPVTSVQVVHAPHEALPTLALPAGGELGVVRARGQEDDVWVVLHSPGGPELPAVPREAQVGDYVALASLSWRAASPDGSVRVVKDGVVLDHEGEWLLEASTPTGVVATLPVYVGEPTPERPPFVGELSGDDPEAATFNAVAAMWDWYGRDAPVRDSGMDSVARARLRETAGGGPTETAEVSLRRAGFVDGAAGAACQAESLRACLEQMWWSPDQRAVFAGDYDSLGVATSSDGHGVRVVVLAAR